MRLAAFCTRPRRRVLPQGPIACLMHSVIRLARLCLLLLLLHLMPMFMSLLLALPPVHLLALCVCLPRPRSLGRE